MRYVKDRYDHAMKVSEVLHLSLAYRYANPTWDPAENERIYGSDSSPNGLGGNFSISAQAELDSPEWDPSCLAPLKELLDHKCLFEDIAYFQNRSSTLENITEFMAKELRKISLPNGRWVSLTVQESRNLKASWDFTKQAMALWWRTRFPMQWQTPTGWGGGEWQAWVAVRGPIEARTGLMFSRTLLKEQIESRTLPHSSRLGRTDGEIYPLAQEVAQEFIGLKGFLGLEISVGTNTAWQFYG